LDRFVGMAVFAKVVEAGSFVAAARHFGLSPAMVSKHVQSIEDRLGVRLLNRTTRRVVPTEVGQDYYERCLRILADLEEADRTASHLQSTARGLLKVTASFSYGIARLTPTIASYLAKYPHVSIELSLNDRYVDLLAEGIDVAIRMGALPDSSLIARRLAHARMIVCASPSYLARRGTPKVPQDLAKHDCLFHTYATSRGVWQFIGPDGREEVVHVAGRFLANNGDALRVLAIQGEGIVLQPSFMVEQDISAGRLVRLLPNSETAEIPIHAVYPHSRHLSAKIRTFVDFLAAELGRAPEHGETPRAVDGDGADGIPRLRVAI
jgi:DNA-binding transcriptional LysR family regulator